MKHSWFYGCESAIEFVLCSFLIATTLWAGDLPVTGVVFKTTDPFLQRLFDAAEEKAGANIVQFTAGMKAMVEGPTFPAVFLETQPMGGECMPNATCR